MEGPTSIPEWNEGNVHAFLEDRDSSIKKWKKMHDQFFYDWLYWSVYVKDKRNEEWFFFCDYLFLLNTNLGMFVVSSGHTDPVGVFNTLSQQQSQQHNQFPNKLPKWFCPNILKYYVLLHDVVEGEQAKWVSYQFFYPLCV